MNKSERTKLLAILKEYSAHPQYSGLELTDIYTKSLFGDYPINIAAILGRLEDIETLLNFGSDINSKGEHGYTPLHYAVEQGHMNVVKFLLEHGANKDITNDDGDTALALSVLLEEEEIMALLNNCKSIGDQ
ncbi:MAG: ankyrin repeat domain-containing protein [Methylobacter sp.]|nr:ankyrin repeat domain-containing protein [Methylobacter sp.]